MHVRELVPIVLLTALVGFVGGQYAKTPRPAPVSRAAPEHAPPGLGESTASVALRRDTFLVETARRSPSDSAPARDDILVRTQIRDGAAGTYINAMLQEDDNLLTRWPDRRLDALRIWIERDPKIEGWKPEYYYAAARAFEEWRIAGFPVALDVVLDSTNTNIRIEWTERFATQDGDQIGLTSKRRDALGWIVAAEIRIATHDKTGKPLPTHVVFGVARHEVGHALGLGHSPSPDDVMFPFSRATTISAADRATLHLLYKLPPGLVK